MSRASLSSPAFAERGFVFVLMSRRMTYQQQLRDPRWQKKRLLVLERDEWKCVSCGDSKTELHVDHIKYRTRRIKAWEYRMDELQTLCRLCHEEKHTPKERPSAIEPTPDMMPVPPERAALKFAEILEMIKAAESNPAHTAAVKIAQSSPQGGFEKLLKILEQQ